MDARSSSLVEGEKEAFEKIEHLLNSFKSSRVLVTALNLGLFEVLRKNGAPMTAAEVGQAAKVDSSKQLDPVLDVLVAEGFLRRTKEADQAARYENTAASGRLLGDPASETYFGLCSDYSEPEWDAWSKLTDVLRTGKTAYELLNTKPVEMDMSDWDKSYQEMERFMRLTFSVLAERFDFTRYTSVLDIGGGCAQLSRILARRHKHLKLTSFDLPDVVPYAQRRIAAVAADIADRIQLVGGDCLKNDLPQPCDVIHIGNVLHCLGTDKWLPVIKRMHDALSPGGALIIVDLEIADKDRLSVMPLIGMIGTQLTGGDPDAGILHEEKIKELCQEAGFAPGLETIHLCGMMSACVAYKKKA